MLKIECFFASFGRLRSHSTGEFKKVQKRFIFSALDVHSRFN